MTVAATNSRDQGAHRVCSPGALRYSAEGLLALGCQTGQAPGAKQSSKTPTDWTSGPQKIGPDTALETRKRPLEEPSTLRLSSRPSAPRVPGPRGQVVVRDARSSDGTGLGDVCCVDVGSPGSVRHALSGGEGLCLRRVGFLRFVFVKFCKNARASKVCNRA